MHMFSRKLACERPFRPRLTQAYLCAMRLANWSSSTRKAFSWTKDLTYVCAFSAAGANFTTVLHEHGCCANASARADALAFCAQNGLDVIIKTDAAGGGPGWDQVNSARSLGEL